MVTLAVMNFANDVEIERATDHFVLRFFHVQRRQASKDDATAAQERVEVASVILPLIAGSELTIKMFEAMFTSLVGLQTSYLEIQTRLEGLNSLGAKITADATQAQKKAAEALAKAKAGRT